MVGERCLYLWCFACRRLSSVAALGVLALIGGLLASAQAADKVRVGKAQNAAFAFVPADVGVEEGIFARYGIEAQILDLSGGAKLQQALAAGGIDVGLGSGVEMAFAAKGAPIIGVAAWSRVPTLSTIVRADSPIKAVSDLKGKSIAVSQLTSLSGWLAEQIALHEGWGPDGVRRVSVGSVAGAVAALKAGQVDAMVMPTETGEALAQRNEGRIVANMAKFVPHFVNNVVFAQTKLVADNPELIARFLKAYYASIRFMKDHPDKAIATATRVLQLSETAVRAAYSREVPEWNMDGQFDPEGVEILKQSYLDMGVLQQKPRDDQLFTTRFLPVEP